MQNHKAKQVLLKSVKMAQWKLRTSFISQIHMFVFSLIFLSCSQDVSERYKICKGFWDYDTTYFIVDTIKDSIIYFSGHNPIRNDTIIKGNHIFIEDVITEECSDRIIVYNPKMQLVYRAYNMVWCFRNGSYDEYFEMKDRPRKPYVIESLDFIKRIIRIRFYNGDLLTLELYDDNKSDFKGTVFHIDIKDNYITERECSH